MINQATINSQIVIMEASMIFYLKAEISNHLYLTSLKIMSTF